MQSLVHGSLYGVFNTTMKITRSIGKGVVNLLTDMDYVQEREREVPSGETSEGFAYGVRDLGLGFFHGVTGVLV